MKMDIKHLLIKKNDLDCNAEKDLKQGVARGERTKNDEFLKSFKGFPRISVLKDLPANAGRCRRYGFDPWIGKMPWKRKWQSTPVFLLRNGKKSHRRLVGYSP